MPKLRVHNVAVSLDGFMAGPDQSVDNPLGVGGTRLHEWALATRTGRSIFGGRRARGHLVRESRRSWLIPS